MIRRRAWRVAASTRTSPSRNTLIAFGGRPESFQTPSATSFTNAAAYPSGRRARDWPRARRRLKPASAGEARRDPALGRHCLARAERAANCGDAARGDNRRNRQAMTPCLQPLGVDLEPEAALRRGSHRLAVELHRHALD